MDKIYFPIEKTVFLPRGHAPIGRLEQVRATAAVDAVEPAQNGCLCYGRLIIEVEYIPMGQGKGRPQEQWKEISRQLQAMGKAEREHCTIAVEFIQELPEQDVIGGCEFIAEVQKKTWQQIAGNALEIGVEIELSSQEAPSRSNRQQWQAGEASMVLEQESFSLEEGLTEPAVNSQSEAAAYDAAADTGCVWTGESGRTDEEDTVIFYPTGEWSGRAETAPREICPMGVGTASKGQHFHESSPLAGVDCGEELGMEGEMAFTDYCPEESAVQPKPSDGTGEAESSETAPCLAERSITRKMPDVDESFSVTEVESSEATPIAAEDTVSEEGESDCEVVPLPLLGKEKHLFFKGKKEKQDSTATVKEDNGRGMTGAYAPVGQKLTEHRKGHRLKFYVVQSGEDLAAIAEKHGLSPAGILAANPNLTEEDIRTGMVLSIPM